MKAWLGALFYCGLILILIWGLASACVGMVKAIRRRDTRALSLHAAMIALCVALCLFALGYEMTHGSFFTNILHSL